LLIVAVPVPVILKLPFVIVNAPVWVAPLNVLSPPIVWLPVVYTPLVTVAALPVMSDEIVAGK